MSPRHGVTEFLSIFSDVGIIFFDIETDILIVLDEAGNIDRVNPAFERILDRAEPDILGAPIIQLIFNGDWSRFLNAFDDLRKGQAFHLLHRESGLIRVKLINFRFKPTNQGRRGYLVLRPLRLADVN